MHYALLADAGVPMICVEWPFMICALIPVVVIEALVIRHRLHLPYRDSLIGAAKANILSTLAGVPLAWGLMLVVEFAVTRPLASVAAKRHWLTGSPLEYVFAVSSFAWTSPSATAVGIAAPLLLVPTFFVSVYLERPSYRRSLPGVDADAINRSVWFANLASYTLLLVVACGWLGWELHTTHLTNR